MRLRILVFGILGLVGCVDTTVTEVTRNRIILTSSAEAGCGSAGAIDVASKMAAVETLRRGFERYIITEAQTQNNTRSIFIPPTLATTTGRYGYGQYSSQTSFYGGGTVTTGSHDAGLVVLMLNRRDPGYSDGIDAKTALGPDWQKLVERGVSVCG